MNTNYEWTKINDFFKLANRNLRKRKLRSWLTMLGIFISIATIFVLVSLSLGLQGAVEKQFEQLGSDKIFIQPKGQLGPPGSTSVAVELTLDDVETVEDISGISEATYMVFGNGKIEFNDKTRYYIISGIDSEDENKLETLVENMGLKMAQGRFLETGDRKEVVIGSLYNDNNLFGEQVELRDTITINEVEYEVVGIAESIGNPGDDQNIYMTYDEFSDLFDSGERVDFILAQIDEGEEINDIANRMKDRLDRERDVDEKTRDYSLLTPEELLATFGNIIVIITVFLGGIAAISLFVGGVGIMNTMYTSVIERTREIGIMKSIGAKNEDVLFIFLIESGLLGLIGGIIGVVLGFSIGKLIEYVAVVLLDTSLLQISAPIWLIISCLSFSFIIGVVSGGIPAWQASKTNTVDALRYE